MSDTILWYATRGAGVVTGKLLLGLVSSPPASTATWR